jgi:hypothetical protein
LKKTLIFQTKFEEIIENKLNKNWKSRRKKPPDKEVWISLKFLSMKELNKLKREMKIMKSVRRKFLRELKFRRSDLDNKYDLIKRSLIRS